MKILLNNELIETDDYKKDGKFIDSKSTNESIDSLLKEIEDLDFYMVYKDLPKFNKDIIQEVTNFSFEAIKLKNLQYLKEELKLIRVTFETNESIVYSLTKKGKDVVAFGGWKEYSENEKKVERDKKRREIVSFWFNIIIPIGSIMVAYLALQIDNKSIKTEIKEELLNEYNNTNQKTIKEEVQYYMEKLNSKKKDSVLPNSVK